MSHRTVCILLLLALSVPASLTGCGGGGGGTGTVLTVSGTVQDAASLAGIVGATVSAQGLSTTTTTGGFFALGNLT